MAEDGTVSALAQDMLRGGLRLLAGRAVRSASEARCAVARRSRAIKE
jgi:hypothetical protein